MILTSLDLQLVSVILWVVIFFIALVIELIDPQLVSVWFAGASLIGLVLAIFNVSLPVQIIVFILSTVVLLILTRPFVKKMSARKLIPTNADALIGKEIIVETPFSLRSQGAGLHADVRWKLITESDTSFNAGEVAIVVALSGNKLVVKKKEGA